MNPNDRYVIEKVTPHYWIVKDKMELDPFKSTIFTSRTKKELLIKLKDLNKKTGAK